MATRLNKVSMVSSTVAWAPFVYEPEPRCTKRKELGLNNTDMVAVGSDYLGRELNSPMVVDWLISIN
eukprot:1182539-Prorocentrum_minimum.AAC.4